MFEYVLEGICPIRVCVQVYFKLTVELCVYVCVCRPGELTDFDCCPSLRLSELDLFFMSGVGGAVRFLVVGTIGQKERPPRGQLWMEQCLTSL